VQPFLRPEANLAIVALTHEPDCSVLDYSIMEDPALQNEDPRTGTPAASSAICWNAGVACEGPDDEGVYSNCTPVQDEGLQPIIRCTSYLVQELHDNQGKEVVMLVLGGVYEDGVDQSVIHDWTEAGVTDEDLDAGITAEHLQFDFGIGPACGGSTP